MINEKWQQFRSSAFLLLLFTHPVKLDIIFLFHNARVVIWARAGKNNNVSSNIHTSLYIYIFIIDILVCKCICLWWSIGRKGVILTIGSQMDQI